MTKSRWADTHDDPNPRWMTFFGGPRHGIRDHCDPDVTMMRFTVDGRTEAEYHRMLHHRKVWLANPTEGDDAIDADDGSGRVFVEYAVLMVHADRMDDRPTAGEISLILADCDWFGRHPVGAQRRSFVGRRQADGGSRRGDPSDEPTERPF